jgi:hypothetical protein
MAQIGYNSGLNGKVRTPSSASAPGIWSLSEQNNLQRTGNWPSSFAGPLSFNPLIWYDASDSNSIELDSGSTERSIPGPGIMAWNDKSGNNRHLLQTAPIRRPTYPIGEVNGKNSVRFFNGVNLNNPPYLVTNSFAMIEPREVYTVVIYDEPSFSYHLPAILSRTQDTISSPPWLVGGGGGGGTGFYGNQSPFYYFTNGYFLNALNGEASTTDRTANVFPDINSTCLIRAVANTDQTVRVPVNERYVVGNDRLILDLQLGYGRFWTGKICEIVAFAEPLSKPNRDFMASYLCDKWGIPQYAS